MVRAKVPREDRDMVREDIRSRLWEKIKSYKGKGRLDNWLRKLASSVITDYQREENKFDTLIEDYCEEDYSSDECLEAELERSILWEEVRMCLEELPKRLRVVAIKRFIEGKSIGTICAQCKKIKEFLRKKLKNFLLDE